MTLAFLDSYLCLPIRRASVIAAVAALASISAAQPTYRWKQIPTRGGFGRPIAMSRNGTILALDGRGYFTYSEAKGRLSIRTVDLVGAKTLFPTCINSLGEVAGGYSLGHGVSRAFIWYPSGKFLDIGTLGGTISYATAINDFGEVVGYSSTTSAIQHAFTWSEAAPWKGVMRDQSVAFPFSESYAYGVDSYGDVVGEFNGKATQQRSVASEWTTNTGTGLPHFFAPTVATAINDPGHIAGWDATSDRCFFWSKQTGYIPISEGLPDLTPVAINNNDEIVGGGDFSPGFLWTPTRGLQSLQSLVQPGSPKIGNAVGIDENGDILAEGGPLGGIIYVLTRTKQGISKP